MTGNIKGIHIWYILCRNATIICLKVRPGIQYTVRCSNEDIMRIIGCCPAILETVEVMVVSPQDNFHMHPLLIFRYLLFIGSVW